MAETRNVRVCILRGTHDGATIPDAACREVFMDGPLSVFQYWKDNSGGLLGFAGSSLQPWVNITLNPFVREPRQVSGQKVYDATASLIGAAAIGAFDVYVVVLHPGTFVQVHPHGGLTSPLYTVESHDGGAGVVLNDRPACTLPVMPNSHTFFCHEVGHTLGLSHSSGVLNDANDWDDTVHIYFRVYGDPYDLMSAMRFGSRIPDPTLPAAPVYYGNPTFAAPAPTGWPVPTMAYGPMLTRAMAHTWDPRSVPADKTLQYPLPYGARTFRFRLGSASRSTPHPVLAMFETPPAEVFPGVPPGEFRCYVEYHTSDGWDRGLDTEGPDLARQGVIVHQLITEDGGQWCTYRGRIVVPLSAREDLKPLFTPLVFHVTDVEANLDSVELEVGVSPIRDVNFTANRTDEAVGTPTTKTVQTPCGDQLAITTTQWRSTTRCRISTRGYGRDKEGWVVSPAVSWTVNGKAFDPEGTTGALRLLGAAGNIVHYEILDDFSTIVFSHDLAKPLSIPVEVTISELDGDFSQTHGATIAGLGQVTEMSQADQARLTACYETLAATGGADNGNQLIRFAKDLIVADQHDLAIDAMVLASQIFTGVAVAAPADPEAKVDAADTLHTLTVRYLEAARIGEATTSATESIAYYSAASDQSGVYPRLTTQLPLFSRELSALPAAASQAQFAAVAVFRKLAPDADAGPVARTDLADQLSTLTVRQIEDERTAVAMGTATETIAIYRETAGLPGADRTHIIRELSILAGRTREAGLTETADLAEQAAAMLANPNPGG